MSAPLHTHAQTTSIPAGSLALGTYCMLLGVIFYVPFMLSPYAQQNDVFMTNLFLGLGLLVAGSAFVSGAATSIAAGKLWLQVTIGVLSASVALAMLLWILSTNNYASAAPILTAYTILVLALSGFAAARTGRIARWVRALLPPIIAAAIVTLYYAFFGSQYSDVNGVATYLPRYLDFQTSELALALGIGVYFIARAWERRA